MIPKGHKPECKCPVCHTHRRRVALDKKVEKIQKAEKDPKLALEYAKRIDATVGVHDNRLDDLMNRIQILDIRFNEYRVASKARSDVTNERLTEVTARANANFVSLDGMDVTVDMLLEEGKAADDKIKALEKEVADLKSRMRLVGRRLARLEEKDSPLDFVVEAPEAPEKLQEQERKDFYSAIKSTPAGKSISDTLLNVVYLAAKSMQEKTSTEAPTSHDKPVEVSEVISEEKTPQEPRQELSAYDRVCQAYTTIIAARDSFYFNCCTPVKYDVTVSPKHRDMLRMVKIHLNSAFGSIQEVKKGLEKAHSKLEKRVTTFANIQNGGYGEEPDLWGDPKAGIPKEGCSCQQCASRRKKYPKKSGDQA